MSRALPIRANQMPMAVRGTFEPSGAHQLEIDLGMSGELRLDFDQVRRIKRAFEAFELEAMRIDGHTNLTNRLSKTLGEF